MADVMTKEQRSRCMARIRGAHTRPEQAVRLVLRTLGIRYRVNVRNLPGRPDIVVRRRRLVVFVHGCFWHRHSCRLGRPVPATNAEFWEAKFAANRARDRAAVRALRREGWTVCTIWECQTREAGKLLRRLEDILGRIEST